ncbi:MAG: SUMF1/EgtB/PvdO family nonheme iron enzyme [Bacteroidales bacterium]|nr:SUMF1/EgtB/PvdO family nonheme iron enzyme [Bacteroidales bacterium]
MKRNTLIHSVLLLVFLAVAVLPLQAQNDKCNNAKNNMEEALNGGNCMQVKKFYYSIYLNEYKCPRDKNLELKINKCRESKIEDQPQPSPKSRTIKVNKVSFTMVYVEGGAFTMGCTSEQGNDCNDDEKPSHGVMLSGYYIGETEVTQALWCEVMESKPYRWTVGYGLGDDYPVYYINRYDISQFIRKLNEKTGLKFRLPTEAEWEYAARGGKNSEGNKYSGSNDINEVAWYWNNSPGKTSPVKSKKANELGLYDMSGNVAEWCNDVYVEYSSYQVTNPEGYKKYSYDYVVRGGCWDCEAEKCRVSYRNRRYDRGESEEKGSHSLGFRLVLDQ